MLDFHLLSADSATMSKQNTNTAIKQLSEDKEINAKRAREISDQEKIELRDKLMRQEQSVDHCTHVLKLLTV